jgi:molecular chaperone DnaK
MYALGIDLGTTYLAAATWRAGRVETVGLGLRAHTVPAAVLIEDDGTVVVGEAAHRRSWSAADRVARAYKRRFGDEVGFLLGDREVSAHWLTGQALRWIVGVVTDREGEAPCHVTVTVPATWRDFRRELMLEVARDAGLAAGRTSIVPEPAAAAIHYAGRRRLPPGAVVGVYDLGGGTMDATVLRKSSDGFEVVGQPMGSDTLGGVDIDHLVLRRVAAALGPAWAEQDRADPAVRSGLAVLRDSVVDAKETLSAGHETQIPVILPGISTDVRLTREELESDIRPTIMATVDVFEHALATAGVATADLTAVLLVGGSSRIPLVTEVIRARLGVPVTVDAHPKYAVCLGAAIAAGAAVESEQRRGPDPGGAQVAPAPGARSGTPFGGAGAPSAAATGDPGASVTVDLVRSGLWAADDVPLRPAVERLRAPGSVPVPADDPLVVNLRDDAGYRSASRRSALIAIAVVVAALAGVAILAALR